MCGSLGSIIGTGVGAVAGGVVGAPGIGASVGGALGGAFDSANAATNAGNLQNNAANQSNNILTQQYNTTSNNLAPYLQEGNAANSETGYLLGLNPNGDSSGGADGVYGSLARPFTNFDMNTDPGYQFRMDQGTQALQRSAAAKGGLDSGAALKAITNYGQNYASNEYQNAYNRFNQNQTNLYSRLSGQQNTGLGATNTQAYLGGQQAKALGDNLQTGAAAQGAAGQVAANKYSTGLGSALGTLSGKGPLGGGMYGSGTNSSGLVLDSQADSSLPWATSHGA